MRRVIEFIYASLCPGSIAGRDRDRRHFYDISPTQDELELDELDRVQGLLDEAQSRLRSLVETLTYLSIRAEHTPDGWLVIDERVEGTLQLPAA